MLVACQGSADVGDQPPWSGVPSAYELRLHDALIGTEARYTSPSGERQQRVRVTAWEVSGAAQRTRRSLDLRQGGEGWERRVDDGAWSAVGLVWDRVPLPGGPVDVHDPWTGGVSRVDVESTTARGHHGLTTAGHAEARFDDLGLVEARWGALHLARVEEAPTSWPLVDVAELLAVPVVDRSKSTVAPRRARIARWMAGGEVHRMEAPLQAELVREPFAATPRGGGASAIDGFAREAVGGAATTWQAHQALVSAVRARVAWAPVPAGASPEQTLASGHGDCTEMVGLYLASATATGLKARSVAGGLWADGRLRPHAWVEVEVGGRWVAVDPTLGQAPADAARLAVGADPASSAAALQALSPVVLLELR